jgi:ribosomal protein S18 acetylase RimI-like enzyme
MPGLSVRPYAPVDAPDVLALWARTIGDRYPLRADVLGASLEGNPDYRPGDAIIASQGDLLVGFGYVGTLRATDPETAGQRGRGWLQAVVVDGDRRRLGIGRRIVGELMEVIDREGVGPVECGGGFCYLWPGLPTDLADARPFVEALGFSTEGRSWDLRGHVAGLTADAAAAGVVEAAGMRVVVARAADRDELLAFIHREFGGEWWHDIRLFLDTGGEPADLLLLRGSEADASGPIAGFARIHTPASRPVGWPMFWAGRRAPAAGGLGPIGIAAELRGRGLGQALLTLALARLRDAGLDDVVIDDTHLLGFYGHLGFTPWIEYQHARATVREVLGRTRQPGDESLVGGDR